MIFTMLFFCGEELKSAELEVVCGLIPSKYHVSCFLIDGGMQGVEDGVVLETPCGVGRSGRRRVVDGTEEAGAI
jgi:hypothetical protein